MSGVIVHGRWETYGDLILRGWRHQRPEVIQADPRTLIVDELLEEIRQGKARPWVTLDGEVLTIRGSNRTVIYRIGEHLEDYRCHVLEWPD
ncbi:MAG TPA: hypothetical protein VG276_28060 [Actinomycetes bacterium]|nr:hypothetical protein [Actinomycetes bacterium]